MNNFAKYSARFFVMISLLAMAGMGNAIAEDKAAAPKVAAPSVEASKAAAPKKGEPVRKTLLDNESVNVIDVTFEPGDVSTSKSRPARMVYYFTAGTLHLSYADGKTEDRTFKAGEAVWRSAEIIEVKNTGKSVVHLLQVTPKTK